MLPDIVAADVDDHSVAVYVQYIHMISTGWGEHPLV